MTNWEIFILFLGFQAFLLSVLFFLKKEGSFRYANRLFSLFLLLCGWLIVYNVLFWTKKLYQPPLIHFNATYVLPLSLIGPVFFFYLKNLVHGYRIRIARDFVHILPFLIIFLMNSSYYLLSTEHKLQVQEEKAWAQYIHSSIFMEVGLLLLMSIYGICAIWKFYNFFGKDEDLRIWVRTTILCYVGCVLSYVAYYSLVYSRLLTLDQDYFITLILCISVMTAAYFAFNYPVIFQGKPIASVIPFIKYKKTGLSENYSKELKENLLDLMVREKPYLNRELRLDDLADALGTARHHTSQVINEHFQNNFFDFINLYRVEEAIRLLEAKKNQMNLAEIGFLSGFNNTVSFNKAFKRHTGTTPSLYRKELISNNV
ncbi:helix-turn-helix domain-containing protein [Muricauda sp. JGD-17]|uniref:Helix-turn-helix domain-containing protein n=1 Tax=Flagellimonas ochracea TaxID=2696472 RepID=A0A964WXI5_9FLAO|nr:helix-turn-helix domain-containing protein [Allomuricauda ochracea]NAY92171.1 helix-turn-helix domain-containing protein [Allomuricauda ochracea]